jgi:hypothetical protein
LTLTNQLSANHTTVNFSPLFESVMLSDKLNLSGRQPFDFEEAAVCDMHSHNCADFNQLHFFCLKTIASSMSITRSASSLVRFQVSETDRKRQSNCAISSSAKDHDSVPTFSERQSLDRAHLFPKMCRCLFSDQHERPSATTGVNKFAPLSPVLTPNLIVLSNLPQ